VHRKTAHAIEAYEHAIRIDPKSADAHYDLALAYHRIKDRQSALKHYEVLKRLDRQLARQLYKLISK
jgi:tetratricopeptide (TPR) repeat protein